MGDLYTFKKMLSITCNELRCIKHDLGEVYMNEEVSDDTKQALLADAFNRIKAWVKYYVKFKDITTTEFDRLEEEKETVQNTYTEQINDMSKLVENLIAENAELKEENKKLKEKFSNKNNVVSTLIEKIDTLEKTVTTENKKLVIASNSNSEVSSNVVNVLNRTLDMIEENASKIANSKRVSSGNFKPAKRIDVDDEIIVKQYRNGMTPHRIAKDFGMTQSAIIYRLKTLNVYVGDDMLKEQYENGVSIEDMSNIYGLEQSVIETRLKKLKCIG